MKIKSPSYSETLESLKTLLDQFVAKGWLLIPKEEDIKITLHEDGNGFDAEMKVQLYGEVEENPNKPPVAPFKLS